MYIHRTVTKPSLFRNQFTLRINNMNEIKHYTQYDQIFDGAEQSPGQSIEPPQCHMMRNVMYQPHQLNAYNVNDKEQ